GPTVLSTLTSILRDEPVPLESAPKVQKVIARCLRKQAVDRYQSVADLRVALEESSDRILPVSSPLDSPVLRLLPKHPHGRLSPAGNVESELDAVTGDANRMAAESPRVKDLHRRSSSAIWVCGALVFTLLAGVVAWRYAAQNGGVKDPEINPITATLAENR